MNAIDRLIQLLSRLPGIGTKSAGRIVYALLYRDVSQAKNLAEALSRLHDEIQFCSRCGGYSEQDICTICENPLRDHRVLCVVEYAQDILTLERVQTFGGIYHVLQGVIDPMHGIGIAQLRITELDTRIQKESIQELIVATNPSVEGDTTAIFLQQRYEHTVKITRLALGLPVGGTLEYSDKKTLARAVQYRTPMK